MNYEEALNYIHAVQWRGTSGPDPHRTCWPHWEIRTSS